MFDFNGDGRTENGELFTGCQMMKDKELFQSNPKTGGVKLGLFDVVMIGLFVLEILNTLCGGH